MDTDGPLDGPEALTRLRSVLPVQRPHQRVQQTGRRLLVWADTTVFAVFSVLTALLCSSAVVVERVRERRGRHTRAARAPETEVRAANTAD
ncbi:hypothetical protein [Streptomyces tendae]|uniref:hypothetical protein n=1 Tax=Streptomyces tendae TaxID=1932 RepID=UPI003D706DD4